MLNSLLELSNSLLYPNYFSPSHSRIAYFSLRLLQAFARSEEGRSSEQNLYHVRVLHHDPCESLVPVSEKAKAPAVRLRLQRPFNPTSPPSPLPRAGGRPPRLPGWKRQRLVPSLLFTWCSRGKEPHATKTVRTRPPP